MHLLDQFSCIWTIEPHRKYEGGYTIEVNDRPIHRQGQRIDSLKDIFSCPSAKHSPYTCTV